MLDEAALTHSAGVAPISRGGCVAPFVEKSLEEGVRED
jgi:hypothetical protein